MSIISVALVAILGDKLPETVTFGEIEKRKYEAFAGLKNFRGRYDVISLPKDGVGVKQEVTYIIGASGRRMKVVVSGSPVVQMGYTALQRWVVDYARKQFVVTRGTGASLPPYAPLICQPGSVNFQVSESGVRIASDPMPRIDSLTNVVEDGKAMVKLIARATNPASGGEMIATQWFDKGGWIVRKFEILSQTNGKTTLSLKGFLRDDTISAKESDADFELPRGELDGFERVDG